MLNNISLIGYGHDLCSKNKKPVNTIPEYHMIHFIESGKGYYNGEQLTAGDAFVCAQDKFCSYYPDPNDPWVYSWINVKGKGADELLQRLPMRKENIFRWNRSANIDIVSKICDYENQTAVDELALIGILYQVFSTILAKKEKFELNYIAEAKRIFESKFDRGITVAEVANKLGISRAYLRNIFYEETGFSPQAFLMQLRLKRAENLLHGNYTVTEIAAAVGYDDVLQFSKIFTKYYGISPANYRKRFKH